MVYLLDTIRTVGDLCCILLTEGHLHVLFIKLKLLCRDVHVPVYHFHKVAFKLIYVVKWDAPNLGKISISIERVIMHFWADEHTNQDQSENNTNTPVVKIKIWN